MSAEQAGMGSAGRRVSKTDLPQQRYARGMCVGWDMQGEEGGRDRASEVDADDDWCVVVQMIQFTESEG